MAEGKGFEPLLLAKVNTLSRRAPSSTRPPFLAQQKRSRILL
ncbi:hypothetical protein MIDIC_240021 [Alphaproteobacteria bacterium]